MLQSAESAKDAKDAIGRFPWPPKFTVGPKCSKCSGALWRNFGSLSTALKVLKVYPFYGRNVAGYSVQIRKDDLKLCINTIYYSSSCKYVTTRSGTDTTLAPDTALTGLAHIVPRTLHAARRRHAQAQRRSGGVLHKRAPSLRLRPSSLHAPPPRAPSASPPPLSTSSVPPRSPSTPGLSAVVVSAGR